MDVDLPPSGAPQSSSLGAVPAFAVQIYTSRFSKQEKKKKKPYLGKAPSWQLPPSQRPEGWWTGWAGLGGQRVAEPLGQNCQQEVGGRKSGPGRGLALIYPWL